MTTAGDRTGGGLERRYDQPPRINWSVVIALFSASFLLHFTYEVL